MSKNKNTTRQYDEEVNTAAKWWADQLRTGKPAGRDTTGRPQTVSEAVGYAFYLSSARVSALTPEQVDCFEVKLRRVLHLKILLTSFDKYHNPDNWHVIVHHEYGPERLLSCAAKHAGFKPIDLELPHKTIMWIHPGEVIVKEGRAAPRVHLYGYEKAFKRWEAKRIQWHTDTAYRTEELENRHWLEGLSIEESFLERYGSGPIDGSATSEGGE